MTENTKEVVKMDTTKQATVGQTPPKQTIVKANVNLLKPSRHFVSSPTSEVPLVSPGYLPRNPEQSKTPSPGGEERPTHREETWPKFPTFLDQDIEECQMDVLLYMLSPDFCSLTPYAVGNTAAKFWDNERKLKERYEANDKFESKIVQSLLKKRRRFIALLIHKNLGLDVERVGETKKYLE